MNTDSKAIVLPAIEETLVIPERAFAIRDEAVSKAKAVRTVFDDETRAAAIAAVRDIKELRLQIEKFRSTAKAPIIAAGNKIEQIVADFSKDIGCGSGETAQGPEEKRIIQLLTRHENEQRRQREEAERKRLKAEQEAREADLERQREITRREEAAKRAEQEAEEARQRAARARSQGGKDKAAEAEAEAKRKAQEAQDEADRLALEAEEAEMERQRREQQAADEAAVLAVPVPGMKVKESWDYEIVSIEQFAHHHPELVEITAKRSLILDAMSKGAFDCPLMPGETCISDEAKLDDKTMRSAPGMRFFRKTTPTIR